MDDFGSTRDQEYWQKWLATQPTDTDKLSDTHTENCGDMNYSIPFWGSIICSQVWAANDEWPMALVWLVFAITIYVIDKKKRPSDIEEKH